MAAFAAGIAAVLVALVSPLEPLAGELLSAHMVQHLLLVLAAAPLLAAGRPQLVIPHALPRQPRWLVHLRRGSLPLRGTSAVPTGLVVAAALHSGALWVWHAPVLYDLPLRHPLAHALEHAAFLGTALALWIALLRPDRRSRIGNGTGCCASPRCC